MLADTIGVFFAVPRELRNGWTSTVLVDDSWCIYAFLPTQHVSACESKSDLGFLEDSWSADTLL